MSVLLAEPTYSRSSLSRGVVDEPISVLIVAKDPISKSGVERHLLGMTDIALLPPSVGCLPDVALVVADTIDQDVLSWIRTIRTHSPSRIVVVASFTDQTAAWATSAGANGVLARGMADGRRLAWVIQKVYRGDALATVVADDRYETGAMERGSLTFAGPDSTGSTGSTALPRSTASTRSTGSIRSSGSSGSSGSPGSPGSSGSSGSSGSTGLSRDGTVDRSAGTADEVAPERSSPVVSDRDRAVLRLLAEGCDTGEIARTLAYSEPTIKNAIQRLFDQLNAKNRPHAVALALRTGII